MNKNYLEFCLEVEATINTVIRETFPRNWDEDFITRSILQNLLKRYSPYTTIELGGLLRPFKVRWDAYKFSGKIENLYGDIGILVQYSTWEGESIEGVGILEAKKRYKDTHRYEAAESKQLKRITSNAPLAQLLLYDYAQMSEFQDNVSLYAMLNPHGNAMFTNSLYTHSLTVPIGIALHTQKYDTSLHKFGIPFSLQLCTRYLRGFDLHHDPEIINAVRGYAESKLGIKFLLVATVSSTIQPPSSDEQRINLNRYERIIAE